jgi:hypothetical protein
MEEGRLQVLHSHYQDTCSALQGFRSQREKSFYWILAALVLVLYDVGAPKQFGAVVGDLLKRETGVTSVPDLSYLSTILLVILLGLILRYCQTVVHIERQYKYLHEVEEVLANQYEGTAFTREGRSYLADYPAFSNWAHYLYTLVFPLLLLVIIVLRAARGFRHPGPWNSLIWIDLLVGLAGVVTVLLYLNVLHGRRGQRNAKAAGGERSAAGAVAGTTSGATVHDATTTTKK